MRNAKAVFGLNSRAWNGKIGCRDHSGRSWEVAAALYVEAKMQEPLAFSSWAQTRHFVRKPDAGDPHVRLDERNLETEHSCASARSRLNTLNVELHAYHGLLDSCKLDASASDLQPILEELIGTGCFQVSRKRCLSLHRPQIFRRGG